MMKPYPAGSYDIAVIGAGHAGIEAALAAARLGCRTIIFTISLDAIGNMPCNPSIGGTAKGHLVRELDALGGEMAKAADATMLQSRMLNLGKGPAVHSLRLQCDRKRYHMYMKAALENQPNLSVRQAEIVSIDTDGAGEITSVTTRRKVVLRGRNSRSGGHSGHRHLLKGQNFCRRVFRRIWPRRHAPRRPPQR